MQKHDRDNFVKRTDVIDSVDKKLITPKLHFIASQN